MLDMTPRAGRSSRELDHGYDIGPGGAGRPAALSGSIEDAGRHRGCRRRAPGEAPAELHRRQGRTEYRVTLDPATTRFIEELTEAADPDAKPIHEMTPEEARGFSESLAALAGPAPQMARVSEHTLERADGNVPLRVVVPIEHPAGVIVFYHGGGWVVGSIDESDTLARKLAERTSCAVVLVDYRLAPEHRYPVAVDDAYAALEWTGAHLDEIAGDGAPLFVAGDSAGGNLAAVVAVRARDRNGPAIAMQILVYPVTDAGLRPALVHGSGERAVADEGRDDLVLGPLPARRSPPLRARCLAAADNGPRGPSAGGRAHR